MEKLKYEKPIIQKLGYDRTAMGIYCVGGSQAGSGDNCPGGNRAHLSCGGGNGVSTTCATGPSPTS